MGEVQSCAEDSCDKADRSVSSGSHITQLQPEFNSSASLSCRGFVYLKLVQAAGLWLSGCCVLQEADTDDNQGTLDFEEFCAFYKMMSTRRDLYLLMLTYSNHKDYLDTDDLKRFLETEQKVGPSQEQDSSCRPSCLPLGMNSLLKRVGTLVLCMWKRDRCLLIFIWDYFLNLLALTTFLPCRLFLCSSKYNL